MKKFLIFILSLFIIFPVASVGYTAEYTPAQIERRPEQPAKVLRAKHVQDEGIPFKGHISVVAHIDEDGKVTSTRIVVSSGSMVLDRMACHIVMEQWEFAPALDESGQPMISDIMCPVYFNMEPRRGIHR